MRNRGGLVSQFRNDVDFFKIMQISYQSDTVNMIRLEYTVSLVFPAQQQEHNVLCRH